MVRNALVTHIDGEQCVAWTYDENLSMSIWEFMGLGKYSASAGGGGLNGEQIVKKKTCFKHTCVIYAAPQQMNN